MAISIRTSFSSELDIAYMPARGAYLDAFYQWVMGYMTTSLSIKKNQSYHIILALDVIALKFGGLLTIESFEIRSNGI